MRFSVLMALAAGMCATVQPAAAGQAPTGPSPLASAIAGQQVPPPAAPQAPAPQPVPQIGQPVSLPATICDLQVPAPDTLPPAGSAAVVYALMPCFQRQGGAPVVEANTYLYYMELKSHVSNPLENKWVPYDNSVEQIILADFRRLWATNFLDDLSIDVRDVRFANGVIGKVVVYDMEERQRIKIVDYTGSKVVDTSKIEEELKKQGLNIRLDSFIDPGLVRKVAGVVRGMYAEKGYQYAEVKPETKSVSGGPKLVHLTFHVMEGPKVKIKDIEFIGNKAIGDGALAKKMKDNTSGGFMRFITGGGTYKEEKFEEDAVKVEGHYRDEGYVNVRVGQPELKVVEDSKDARTRYVQLRIPVTEGLRYKVGTFVFDGNTVVSADALRPLFKLEPGEYYSEKKVRKGLEKAKEMYGTGGYFEFNAFPDLSPRDRPAPAGEGPAAAGPPVPAAPPSTVPGPPIVDVTMRVQEGKQYFINRISFTGNTTTRDNVIRREIRMVESGVFNTEALKYSIKRLNQLGYFKPLEGEAIGVDKTPGADNKVDITLKLEEQNRNQITFGAGVSQFDGFFGQLSFQTSNFLGRGETFSVSAQQGSRAKNYQVAFTEPFLFDRPITAGVDFFIREIDYTGLYTQKSRGANLTYGFQVAAFSRMFVTYSFERVSVTDLNSAFTDPRVLQGNPLLADSLLIGLGGHRTISKIGPSFVYNTIDSPIFPSQGARLTLAMSVAGLGGNTNFISQKAEVIKYWQHTRRTSLGIRAGIDYIRPYGSTQILPIFEKIFLGGEYSIRGFDLRTVGPRDPVSQVVIGGNKSMLGNVEYLITIAGPVRLVLFADAGQVRDTGQSFGWKEPITRIAYPPGYFPLLSDPFATTSLKDPDAPVILPTLETLGYRNAWKSSVGAEIRFFMPVLNVPFRLIFAANPSRAGVLDNNLQPEKLWKFRFAVGTTF